VMKEEEEDEQQQQQLPPPASELERFRCPLPDCNFWTDWHVSIFFSYLHSSHS
jgi:hypothetical protein